MLNYITRCLDPKLLIWLTQILKNPSVQNEKALLVCGSGLTKDLNTFTKFIDMVEHHIIGLTYSRSVGESLELTKGWRDLIQYKLLITVNHMDFDRDADNSHIITLSSLVKEGVSGTTRRYANYLFVSNSNPEDKSLPKSFMDIVDTVHIKSTAQQLTLQEMKELDSAFTSENAEILYNYLMTMSEGNPSKVSL